MKRFFALLSLVGLIVAGLAAARAVKRWLEGPEPEPFETGAYGNGAAEMEWSNALDEELLSILVDPQSKKPLEYDEENSCLISYDSRLKYPIQNGIPVMLIDKAERIPDDAQPRPDLPKTGLGEETIKQVREYRQRKAGAAASSATTATSSSSSSSSASSTATEPSTETNEGGSSGNGTNA